MLLYNCVLVCRTVFSVDDGMHNEQLEAGEKAVLEGTSKWECKVQVTGTWNGVFGSVCM